MTTVLLVLVPVQPHVFYAVQPPNISILENAFTEIFFMSIKCEVLVIICTTRSVLAWYNVGQPCRYLLIVEVLVKYGMYESTDQESVLLNIR